MSKLPKCPICGMDEELPHDSCKILCFECGQFIKNLDCYYLDEHDNSIFHRFCNENCKTTYLDKKGKQNESV